MSAGIRGNVGTGRFRELKRDRQTTKRDIMVPYNKSDLLEKAKDAIFQRIKNGLHQINEYPGDDGYKAVVDGIIALDIIGQIEWQIVAKRNEKFVRNSRCSEFNDDRRRLFETCTLKAKRVCNPTIDWTDADVWDYIRSEHLTLNPLYQCGFYRVGCVGCPLASKKNRVMDFARYPKYREMYIQAFEKMLEARRERGEVNTKYQPRKTGLEVFHFLKSQGKEELSGSPLLPGLGNYSVRVRCKSVGQKE